MTEMNQDAAYFLDLIRRSRRGKFKIYMGMSAGVGKTYRMLQEAHTLFRNGVDVKIAYIETHNREETQALIKGLPIIPRRKLFYKGKELEEMDTEAVIRLKPEVVIVDELAHTNIEGSKHEKRWEDVLDLLDAGISVISAINIQHIESLNREVKAITGIDVSERIPDRVLGLADEVVNIDLTADELIGRLKEGKIYPAEKIQTALNHFFRPEHILQLRELALKEVAAQVERKVERELPPDSKHRPERFLACISTNEGTAKNIIRKTARLASYYNAQWFVLYVQTPAESASKIALDKQRHLINHFKLATELGAEVIQVKNNNIPLAMVNEARRLNITTLCMGKPHLSIWKLFRASGIFRELLKHLDSTQADLIIFS